MPAEKLSSFAPHITNFTDAERMAASPSPQGRPLYAPQARRAASFEGLEPAAAAAQWADATTHFAIPPPASPTAAAPTAAAPTVPPRVTWAPSPRRSPASSNTSSRAPSVQSDKSSSASGSSSSVSISTASSVAKPESRVPVAAFNQALRDLNAELNQSMGFVGRNVARVVTGVGVLGSIGGGVAMALAAPAALAGAMTGVGIPHAAALAIAGVGVGVIGTVLSVLAGTVVRKLARRGLKRAPQFASKIVVLKQMEATLAQKAKIARLDQGDAALLHNTRALLRKVDDGFGNSLRKQIGNALATPVALFAQPFAALRRALAPTLRNPDGSVAQPTAKKLRGEGFFASLGVTRLNKKDDQAPADEALQSNAAVWLAALKAPATPMFD